MSVHHQPNEYINTNHPTFRATVNIVGVDQKVIIMFIFVEAGTPYLLFYKAVIPTHKRVWAVFPTRFLGKRSGTEVPQGPVWMDFVQSRFVIKRLQKIFSLCGPKKNQQQPVKFLIKIISETHFLLNS
jgi:hypothetical protein